MMQKFTILLFMFLLSAFYGMAQAPFTAGNFVVCRVGNGSATLATTTSPVFLDEYTPSGVLVQSIAMPTSGTSLTINRSGSVGGYLNLSADGRYLTLAGYNSIPGSATGGAQTIGLIDYNGTINTSTVNTDIPFTIKSVISDNGTNLWMGGGFGINYSTIGATTSTILSPSGTGSGVERINIANGQLYISGGGTSANTDNVNIATVGTGLPTTAGQTINELSGVDPSNSYYQFIFADMDPGVPGVDVLYTAAGTGNVGIQKYSLVGGTWVLNGTIGLSTDFYRGLTVKFSGTTATIFATRKGSNNTTILGGEIVSLVDASGYNGTFSGTPSTIVTLPYTANTAGFRGLALVPQAPPVKVAIKTFLQGAYSSGLNRHKDVTSIWAGILNANALSQPYNTAAFNNYAGTESVSAGFFTSTGATTDILDWVLVELRNSATPATVVARRAAFIREDGRIVDLDGTSDVSFPGVAADNYYVVVRHRNHLAIRSSSAIALSSTATLYDFSAQQSNAYQDGAITTNAAMKDVSGGGTVFAMWGGNANSNTKVSFTGVNNDAGSILGALGGNQGLVLSSVYNFADLNLDGSVKYTGTNNDSGLLLSVLGSNQAAVYSQHQ